MAATSGWIGQDVGYDIMNHIFGFGDSNMTMPTNLYLALHNGFPGVNGGSNEVEGVTRVAIDDWEYSASRTLSNIESITFPAATANLGDVTYWSVWDQSTGGTCLVVGEFTTPPTINAGKVLNISPGELEVSIGSDNIGGVITSLAEKILKLLFGIETFTPPTSINVALYFTKPDPDGTGGLEVDDDDYVQQQHDAWNLITGSASWVSNDGAIVFPAAAADYTDDVRYVVLFDESENMLFYGQIGYPLDPVTVPAGDHVEIVDDSMELLF